MLHDVDKSSDDRGKPMPNKKDQLPPDIVMAKNTLSTTHIGPQTPTAGQRVQLLNQQLIGLDSNNNAVILFGLDSTGNMVIKAAQPGYDARTASVANLIFSSNEGDVLQVAEIGNITIPAITAANNTQVTQTATYTFSNVYTADPIVLAFVSSSNLFAGGNYTTGGVLSVISYGEGSSQLAVNIATVSKVVGGISSTTFTVQLLNYGSGGSYTYPATPLTVYVFQPSLVA